MSLLLQLQCLLIVFKRKMEKIEIFCSFLKNTPSRSDAHNGCRQGQYLQGRRTLMLKALGLALLAVELGSDLLKQLVQASIAGRHSSHAAVRVHGHGW